MPTTSTSSASIRIFEDVLPVYGNWGQINANVASLYANSGDYDRARSYMLDGINYDPGKAIHYCLLGDYQKLESLDDQAIISYSTCLIENANWIDTPYWQSDHLKTVLIKDIREEMATKSFSNEGRLITEYARVLFIEGRFDEIKPAVVERLSQGPENPDLQILYARYLADSGQFSEAEDELMKVIENDPRNSNAWYVLAGMYLEQGQLEESLYAIDISTALKATRENLALSGLINLRIGNPQEAIMKYSWALNWMKRSSIMSAWTARRFPVQLEKLSCIPDLVTFRGFYEVVWEGIKELSINDCEEAERIYSHIEDEMFPGFGEMYGEFPKTCEN